MRALYEVIKEYDPDKNYSIHITPTIAKYPKLSKKKFDKKIIIL